MMGKASSVFLCILLISVLLLPSTPAGRALLQTEQTETESGNHGGDDRSKIGVHGSTSPNAHSKTGSSPPSESIPVGKRITYKSLSSPLAAGGCRGACNVRESPPPPARCTRYQRNCK